MKKVEYDHEKILKMVALLNSLKISEIENFRIISAVANILDGGIIKEIPDKKKEGEKKENDS